MKKFVLALSAVAALAASPAMAGDTRIHFGFYSPEPVFYAPPVAYYGPTHFVRYEKPCPKRYARAYRHGYRHGMKHERRYESAWNEPRGGYGHGWRH